MYLYKIENINSMSVDKYFFSSFQESVFHSSSPTRRRESTPLLEKIKTDVSMGKMKLTSTWKKEEKLKEVKEDSPIMKYISSQVKP